MAISYKTPLMGSENDLLEEEKETSRCRPEPFRYEQAAV
jgi:hypothetical protein